MLLLRRAAGFAALLPALLACGAPELLARALGCDDANTARDDANTPSDTTSSSTAAAASSLCTIASSSSNSAAGPSPSHSGRQHLGAVVGQPCEPKADNAVRRLELTHCRHCRPKTLSAVGCLELGWGQSRQQRVQE